MMIRLSLLALLLSLPALAVAQEAASVRPLAAFENALDRHWLIAGRKIEPEKMGRRAGPLIGLQDDILCHGSGFDLDRLDSDIEGARIAGS